MSGSAALCTPCREGAPQPACDACRVLGVMIEAIVEQFFPGVPSGVVQVHMAGTPPWERKGWEAELDAEIAAADTSLLAQLERRLEAHQRFCSTCQGREPGRSCQWEQGMLNAMEVVESVHPTPQGLDGNRLKLTDTEES